jgi:hypothetical protein
MVHDCDDNDYIQMVGLFGLNWNENGYGDIGEYPRTQ